jgi:hypothetical protein
LDRLDLECHSSSRTAAEDATDFDCSHFVINVAKCALLNSTATASAFAFTSAATGFTNSDFVNVTYFKSSDGELMAAACSLSIACLYHPQHHN